MLVCAGRPTENIGPPETGVNDTRPRAVGAEQGWLTTREKAKERREMYTTGQHCQGDKIEGLHLHFESRLFLGLYVSMITKHTEHLERWRSRVWVS